MAAAALGLGAVVFIGWVLWPRWPVPPVAVDTPSLPITIAGVGFNVPPEAIRVPTQRWPGAHERIDLAFLWPSLAPPGTVAKPSLPPSGAAPTPPTRIARRLFVTIVAAGNTLAPAERASSIYPRYAEGKAKTGPDGLAVLAFRDDSPYRGEDLIYEARRPPHFFVRCSRDAPGPVPGICLYARRIAAADFTVRFPRDWLKSWLSIRSGIARLIARLRSRGA